MRTYILVICALGLGALFGCRGERIETKPDLVRLMADAINHNDPQQLRQALRQGADPNVQTLDGSTMLHAAAGMHRKECVRVLLEGGADPKIRDNEGRTPLDVATRLRAPAEIIDMLRQAQKR